MKFRRLIKAYTNNLPGSLNSGESIFSWLNIYPSQEIHVLSDREARKADRDALMSDWKAITKNIKSITDK